MTHNEHWDFKKNSYDLTTARQIPPLQVFPYRRFTTGNNWWAKDLRLGAV